MCIVDMGRAMSRTLCLRTMRMAGARSNMAEPSSAQCENVGRVNKSWLLQLPPPEVLQPETARLQTLSTRTMVPWAWPTGFPWLGSSGGQGGSSVKYSFSESGPWGRGWLLRPLCSSPLCWLAPSAYTLFSTSRCYLPLLVY